MYNNNSNGNKYSKIEQRKRERVLFAGECNEKLIETDQEQTIKSDNIFFIHLYYLYSAETQSDFFSVEAKNYAETFIR